PLADTSRAARRARRDSLQAERRGEQPTAADSLRTWNYAARWSGGRYELHRPANDSLARFTGWPEPLSLETDPAEERRQREMEEELARLADGLAGPLTGQPAQGVAYERLSDILRYDRVQGLSLGLGYQARLPGVRFTGLYGTARYGLSDERVTGRLTLLRDAPGGRLAVSGYREIGDADPFGLGRGFGNTLNALFAAHDNGDYYLAHGGLLGFETSIATGLDLSVGARLERQTSIARSASSEVNDFLGGSGAFPGNPPVDDGTYGGASVRLSGIGGTRWWVTADVLAGESRATGRLFGELRREVGGRSGVTLRLKGGLATRPALRQSLFRLGGLNTVRGFDYGTLRGQAFWAAQLDLAPIAGRLRPVAFLDAGQAARPGDLFDSKALVGGGVGVSLFNGLLRFDLSHPISPDTGGKLRFDIVVQGAR
ncbi:MAG TPA: ShlB/FhaC/HecB family hemolysin secretion/activation protein, partial [Gemmatimonadales bacterium]|nr:ShlB/FhaC/HecB family hemolysin secretion/activation protein [Gemmatimonadales bacterium]